MNWLRLIKIRKTQEEIQEIEVESLVGKKVIVKIRDGQFLGVVQEIHYNRTNWPPISQRYLDIKIVEMGPDDERIHPASKFR